MMKHGATLHKSWGSPWQRKAVASLALRHPASAPRGGSPAYASGRAISYVSPCSRQSNSTSRWSKLFRIRYYFDWRLVV